MPISAETKKKFFKYGTVTISWAISSGLVAYLLLTFVLPTDSIPETVKALNLNGQYEEATKLSTRYESILPSFLLSRVKDKLLLERAKSEIGQGRYEAAVDTLARIKTTPTTPTLRDDFFLTKAQLNLARAERAKSKSDIETFSSAVTEAHKNFNRLDNPTALGSIAILTQMNLFNNLGHISIETNSTSQGKSDSYYVKARKTAIALKGVKETKYLDEYIESLNGQSRLEMETKQKDFLESSIYMLKLVNTISEDFGFNEHVRYSCNELGVAYYQLGNLELSERWLSKALEKGKKQYGKDGLSNDEKRWIDANLSATRQSLAAVMLKRGRTGLAIEVLKELLTHSSDTQIRTSTSLKLAQAYVVDPDTRNLDTARRYLNDTKSLIGDGNGRVYDSAALELWYGHLCYLSTKTDEALKHYGKAKTLYEDMSQTGSNEYQAAISGLNGNPPTFYLK